MNRVITDLHALGTAIREARLARGWTQLVLAERAGVSRRFVQDVERGLRPGAEVGRVLAVLRAFGLGISLAEADVRTFDQVLNEVFDEMPD